MSNDWRTRLQEVIKRDGRSLRAITSATEGVGENYVQQVLKDEKDPGFTRLAKVLATLGPEATVYVTSGMILDPEEHLRVALVGYGITDTEHLKTALNVARTLSGRKVGGKSESSLPDDQPQPANLPHGSGPSKRRSQRSDA